MKKLVFTIVLVLCSIASWAELREIDGIYYYLDSTTGKASVENPNADAYEIFVAGCPSYSGDIIIPETVTYEGTTYTVNELGLWAFRNSHISFLDIPATVTKISDAFYDADLSTMKVHWTDNIPAPEIYYGEKLYIPKGTAAKYLQYSCWSEFKEIYEYDEDGNLTPVDNSENVFTDTIYYNYNDTTKEASVTFRDRNYRYYWGDVIIPETVTKDGVTYTVTSIGDKAFWASTITSIQIPNTVTSLGELCLSECRKLKTVKIPEGVTSIGRRAFAYCDNLQSIEIPDAVTTMGPGVFLNCYNMTSVKLSNSLTSIGNEFFQGCSGITSIELPNTVTSIGSNAFWGCGNLGSIEIPNSVTTIYEGTFRWCLSLTSITIPASVTSIDRGAFWYCKSLNKIINLSQTPQTISDTVFESDLMYDDYNGEDDTNISGIDLYVLEDCVAAYKAANTWRYMNIIGFNGDGIKSVNDGSTGSPQVRTAKCIENGKVVIVCPDGTRYTIGGQRME